MNFKFDKKYLWYAYIGLKVLIVASYFIPTPQGITTPFWDLPFVAVDFFALFYFLKNVPLANGLIKLLFYVGLFKNAFIGLYFTFAFFFSLFLAIVSYTDATKTASPELYIQRVAIILIIIALTALYHYPMIYILSKLTGFKIKNIFFFIKKIFTFGGNPFKDLLKPFKIFRK